jgi:hypothetical protein
VSLAGRQTRHASMVDGDAFTGEVIGWDLHHIAVANRAVKLPRLSRASDPGPAWARALRRPIEVARLNSG